MFGFILVKSNVFMCHMIVTDVIMNTIGKSLGHKSTSATQVYARLTVDPVRNAMQKVTDKMMEFVSDSE